MTERLERLLDMRAKSRDLTKRAEAMGPGPERTGLERTRNGIDDLYYACANRSDVMAIELGELFPGVT